LTFILPPQAASAFAVGLHDAEPGVRRQASAGFVKMSTPAEEILPALLEALKDPEWRVRANAAAALAKCALLPANAEAPLVASATASLSGLRRYVAAALGRVDSARSREILRGMRHDPNSGVRTAATQALAHLEPESTQAEATASLAPGDALPPSHEQPAAESGDSIPAAA
jgi:HEAT repeat protein